MAANHMSPPDQLLCKTSYEDDRQSLSIRLALPSSKILDMSPE